MACTHGAATQLAINGKKYGFTKFLPDGTVQHLIDGSSDSITGRMALAAERTVQGPLHVRFGILMEVTYLELVSLLEEVLGFDQYGAIEENVPEVDVVVEYAFDPGDDSAHKYEDCKCGVIRFSGNKGTKPILLALEFFGKDWLPTYDFDAYAPDAIDPSAPFVFIDANLTDIARHKMDRVSVTINRHIHSEHNYSRTPTDVCPRFTEVTIADNTPYTDDQKTFITTALENADGSDATLQIESGDGSALFTFANVKLIAQPAPIKGKENVRQGLFYRAYEVTDDDQVITPVVTIELTPA